MELRQMSAYPFDRLLSLAPKERSECNIALNVSRIWKNVLPEASGMSFRLCRQA